MTVHYTNKRLAITLNHVAIVRNKIMRAYTPTGASWRRIYKLWRKMTGNEYQYHGTIDN